MYTRGGLKVLAKGQKAKISCANNWQWDNMYDEFNKKWGFSFHLHWNVGFHHKLPTAIANDREIFIH